ncbi:hypothetical protein [Pseudoxanthomonas sp. PXM01]|uniref:hypothetical protein n=1 Tax=Pseudoxanthomonas sp. PXM01 TaxID=2769295 RepID=UPI001780808F|nr:hypothetical protein [Pseudoxanthomonas sp. PXM01]MBD9469150.1 hypothetical protein [Pseudoxanthomonas sp. PXM01]
MDLAGVARHSSSITSMEISARALCPERIEERLADAENLVRGRADIGNPHYFIAGLWEQTYRRAPRFLGPMVSRRIGAMARSLGVASEAGAGPGHRQLKRVA